jgi:ABC-2 type transport system permease protein
MAAGSLTGALARRAFREGRTRTISFAAVFALFGYIQPVGYRGTYPTATGRLEFARSFSDNLALRMFYGTPQDVLSVGGYTAWRVGGTLAIAAAVFGLLAAVRALRTEEDSGRMELVLSGAVGRGETYRAALVAIAAGTGLLWLAEFAGFLAGGVPAGGSAYLALATASVVPVCAGVGAVMCQLAPDRRVALQLGGAVVGLFFMVRVIADTAGGAEWLRWATPLGWAEEMRPFTGARPLVLALPLAAAALSLLAAGRIGARRDVGTGMLPARDTAAPRLGLLSSPSAQALRSERTGLVVWALGIALFAGILGVVAKGVTSAKIPAGVQHELAKVGSASLSTATGYLAFVFIFFVLAVSLFGVAQVGAARHAEAEQQLETLFALPVGRARWLGGRLALAGAAAAALCALAGLFTWAGAGAAGVGVSLPRMIEAGLNCLPVALLFLGVAALADAVAPRAGSAIAYGLVTVAFLWQLVGSLLGAPSWLVDVTPFAHVALVPTQPFAAGAAAVMLAIGAAAALAALGAFRRRDLLGA